MMPTSSRTSLFKNACPRAPHSKVGSFLFLGVTLAFILPLYLKPTPPRIATVNVSGLVTQFVKTELRAKKSNRDMAADVKHFGETLETTLNHLAKTQHQVILPREAVMAGSDDETQQVAKALGLAMPDAVKPMATP